MKIHPVTCTYMRVARLYWCVDGGGSATLWLNQAPQSDMGGYGLTGYAHA